MRRPEFIAAIGSGAVGWPFAARAQQPERIRRIGVLFGGPNDANFQSKFAVFQQVLQQLGWIDGRNIEFNIRWGGNDAERIVTEARELVRARPDVILVGPTNALVPLKKETESIPIGIITATRVVLGAISRRICRYLPIRENSELLKPVMLPVGRARLSTMP